jgi:hypothetical protein
MCNFVSLNNWSKHSQGVWEKGDEEIWRTKKDKLQNYGQNDTTSNFILVCVGCEEGCVGVVVVVTGISAPQATCTCAYQQVTKRTTKPHVCKIRYFKIRIKPCVVRGTVIYKTMPCDRLCRGLSLMSINIPVVPKSDFLPKVNIFMRSLQQID